MYKISQITVWLLTVEKKNLWPQSIKPYILPY